MPFTEQDYDKIFSSFTSSGGSTLKELYSIMPSLDGDQQNVYLAVKFIADKWDCVPIQKSLEEFLVLARNNRSLGLFPSMRSFLRSMTLEEHLRGFKVQSGSSEPGGK